jgi:hypothetical protein
MNETIRLILYFVLSRFQIIVYDIVIRDLPALPDADQAFTRLTGKDLTGAQADVRWVLRRIAPSSRMAD